jgi:DNA-binding transcriptional ArsR family regulator
MLEPCGRILQCSYIQIFDFIGATAHTKRLRRVGFIPNRAIIAKELANLLNALSHPHRVRIVEELRDRELDVNSIQEILGISHSAVSQNLSVLRAHHLVRERRDGRRVIYALVAPALAAWLMGGLQFLQGQLMDAQNLRAVAEQVKDIWGGPSGG